MPLTGQRRRLVMKKIGWLGGGRDSGNTPQLNAGSGEGALSLPFSVPAQSKVHPPIWRQDLTAPFAPWGCLHTGPSGGCFRKVPIEGTHRTFGWSTIIFGGKKSRLGLGLSGQLSQPFFMPQQICRSAVIHQF